jgi:signal transduction histidine kinase
VIISTINSPVPNPLYNPPSGHARWSKSALLARNQFVVRHPWVTALVALVAVQVLSSGTLKGATLAAVADVLQFAIMIVMVVGTAINIAPNHGRAREFWSLMTLSAAMWATDYGTWVYYEVFRGISPPVSRFGDILLVLHVVPILMAFAIFPYRTLKPEWSLSSHLEFPLIACWWVYLYFHFVFVWQYMYFYPPKFHLNFNLLYHAELATVIVVLLYFSRKAHDGWHKVFHHYLIGFVIYAPTSAIINILIQQQAYSSGGIWDLPLTISIAYLAWIGFYAHKLHPEPAPPDQNYEPGLAHAWAASIAVISIPAIALFSYERLHDPAAVRHFRVALGFTAMFVIAVLIFTRQQLLNRRLVRLLSDSKRAYDNLEHLQTQMMQSEKLASIGRLISGAAHELNNPLTAILGYAELISSDQSVPAEPRGFGEKISQQARRTRNLVANLLSFARQTPPQKRLTDLNVLIKNACQLHVGSLPPRISLVRDLQPDLPLVMGDDNLLLQVFVHVLNNAVDAVTEVGGGEIIVRTQQRGDNVVLEVCDSGPGIAEPGRVFDPFYTTKPPGKGTGLGLSACYGIIQEHEGTIECFNIAPRGAVFRISLKVAARTASTEPAVMT